VGFSQDALWDLGLSETKNCLGLKSYLETNLHCPQETIGERLRVGEESSQLIPPVLQNWV
jgi:hypothetical protein